MSFEYIVEPEQKKKTLDEIGAEDLAAKIAGEYIKYNDARRANLDKANALYDEIFFKNAYGETNNREVTSKEEEWKSKAKLGKEYMFYQTMKAFVWKNIYANINQMFDVSGENEETDNNSNKQKANLVYVFEKMGLSKTLDKIIDYFLFYGELISFSAWKKKYQQYRRPVDYFKSVFKEDIVKLPKVLEAVAKGKNYYIDEKQVYDNPYVYAVNPADLVFDVTQKDNWESCPKIYRTFKTPDDILNNKYYKISPDLRQSIDNLAKEATEGELRNQSDKDLEKEVHNGGTVEVLEHWGNLKLKDGTVLKNWYAVVVGRKYLVQFEKNQRILNPFTYGEVLTDPDTKRGISILYSVLDLAHLQEDLYNRTADMQSLTECPPIFAPKEFFDNKDVKLYPGKIIAYGDNLNPANIKPLEFNTSVFTNNISNLDNLMAEISGIFPNMAGAEEQRAKTATEISTKAQGQVTRLSMIIDTINQYLIIPVVENVAKLLADFKFGTEEIYINKNNQPEKIEITDEIRQGDYKYTYSDRTMTADRIQKADMVVATCKEFANFIPLNAEEIFTWYMEQKGVDTPERFLQQGAKIPQEIQNMLVQQPEIQALMAGYEQRKQEMAKGQAPQPQLEQAPPMME